MKKTKRIADLPPYLFAQIDASVDKLRKSGREIIELSKSDPDHPTAPEIVAELCARAQDAENHHYPDFDGLEALRQAAAAWYMAKYQIQIDPQTQVLPLLGSKEGIVHICEAFVDAGDLVLVPDPGFPSYKTGTVLAGGKAFPLPLRRENNYLPDLDQIPAEVAKAAKLMFLNYPNNPTGAVATSQFFARVVEFAKKNDIIVCHDNAYSQTTFKGYRAPSFLSTPGAMELGAEFFTFSKAFNMAGWRLGLLIGNAELIAGLKIIETHVNAGIFAPIQYAGAKALGIGTDGKFFSAMNEGYHRRLTKVVEFFNAKGWHLDVPKGTVYLWVPCPSGYSSIKFTQLLLDEAGVAVSPGTGFVAEGEGHIRICVTYPDGEIEKALDKIGQCLDKFGLKP
ncbi:MAG TPA: aminotransferase class I/II-fold pyridoxal phosphate-dependent enzyme [Verrucomicrobiae bacterium]|nr:aminotransferase class I/II-fold pyridoxal phosphate-dependent enzyme [Verrucomicrobiae bacterium]